MGKFFRASYSVPSGTAATFSLTSGTRGLLFKCFPLGSVNERPERVNWNRSRYARTIGSVPRDRSYLSGGLNRRITSRSELWVRA